MGRFVLLCDGTPVINAWGAWARHVWSMMSISNELMVEKTVTAFLASYAAKDCEGCIACLARSRPLMLMGTNADEVFTSVEQVQAGLNRDFEMMEDLTLGSLRRLQVTAGSDLASVLLEVPLSYRVSGTPVTVAFRYALVLIPEAGQWKIVGGITSVAAGEGNYSFS